MSSVLEHLSGVLGVFILSRLEKNHVVWPIPRVGQLPPSAGLL